MAAENAAPKVETAESDNAVQAAAMTHPVADANYNEDDWVQVVLKGQKDMPPGQMPRAYFEGWGRDLGWQEVK